MHAKDVEGKEVWSALRIDRRSVVIGAVAAPFFLRRARAAEAIRAYSIWPENYARPMLETLRRPQVFTSISCASPQARRWRV